MSVCVGGGSADRTYPARDGAERMQALCKALVLVNQVNHAKHLQRSVREFVRTMAAIEEPPARPRYNDDPPAGAADSLSTVAPVPLDDAAIDKWGFHILEL